MINRNDPRLLEYVLGELPESEAEEIRQAEARSSELQQAINDYRKLANALIGIYASEPLPERTTVDAQSRSTALIPGASDCNAEWRWTRFALQATLVLFFCAGLYAVINPAQTSVSTSSQPIHLVSFVSVEDIERLESFSYDEPTVQFPARVSYSSSEPNDSSLASNSAVSADAKTAASSEDTGNASALPRLEKSEKPSELSDFGYSPEELAQANLPLSSPIEIPGPSVASGRDDTIVKPETFVPGSVSVLAYRMKNNRQGTKSSLRNTVQISHFDSLADSLIRDYDNRPELPTVSPDHAASAVSTTYANPESWQEVPFVSPLEKPISRFAPVENAESYFLTRSFLLDMRLLPPASIVDPFQIINYLENQQVIEEDAVQRADSEPATPRVSIQLGAHPWLKDIWLAKIVIDQEQGFSSESRFQVQFCPTQIGSYRCIGSWTRSQNGSPESNRSEKERSAKQNGKSQSAAHSPEANEKRVQRVVALYELVPLSTLSSPEQIPGPSGYAWQKQSSEKRGGSPIAFAPPRQESTNNLLAQFGPADQVSASRERYSGPKLVTPRQKSGAYTTVFANYGQDVGATPIRLLQLEISPDSDNSGSSANRRTFKYRFFLPSQEIIEKTAYQPTFRFTAAVALWAQLLGESQYCAAADLDSVEALLEGFEPALPCQKEFIEMVRQTKQLNQETAR